MKLRKIALMFTVVGVLLALVVPFTFADGPVSHSADAAEATVDARSHRLIVQLASPSLTEWSAATRQALTANGRLDVQSAAAQAYVNQLQTEQAAFVNAMQATLPNAKVDAFTNEFGQAEANAYQITFNGMAIDLGDIDQKVAFKTLSQMANVKGVYFDFAHSPSLYTSTTLINAPAIWNTAGGQADAGQGVKVASMDGGLHKDAAMFDGTGWSYPADFPPNGLGLTSNNNGKIIASRAYFRSWDPPSAGDENPWPGTQGTSHGTHTGSTAAGNIVTGEYVGLTFPNMSGVAPGAWLMSYRVFYNSVTNDGSFYTAEGIAALEDIVADGADVVNNSWGAGPGSLGGEFDPLDTALVNAVNAGVFVSMSAGNAGPGRGTGDHPSSEYINVAASTTSGTLSSGRLNINAPAPISASLQSMPFAPASFGASLPVGDVLTYPFVVAANVDPGNFEGCNPWPADTFTGVAAVISRGGCEFGVKVLNAEQAGAQFVVVHNHASGGEGLVSMAPGEVGNQVTIASIFIGHTNGLGVTAWHAEHSSASEMTLDLLAFQAGNDPDEIISFSSRGPGIGNVLKPDIAAPGVNILAQGYAPGASGEARHLGYGQVSGTSMAAPHVAGAAALLKQLQPDWSNADIKSALMTTAKYQDIYNFDGSPAQPLDMGAGRLDLTHAADPGVILSPPSGSFGLVDEGDSKTINVTVRNVSDQTESYTLTTWTTEAGFPGTIILPGFSVSPANITLDPGQSTVINITFDSTTSNGVGDNQGYIVMDGESHDAHMPVWGRVVPAAAAADVLIIQNDFGIFGFPNYINYYTETVEALGYSYHVWNADVYYGTNETTIPDAVTLSGYRAIVYYTGYNFYPDNSTILGRTPLTAQDMNRLTEYANNGGLIIAMGQDMSSVLDDSFFDDYVLGDEQLQDSVSGETLPALPVIPSGDAPSAFQSMSISLSGLGDGAANQYYVDEMAAYPNLEPDGGYTYPYLPLLKYPGPYNMDDGTVAMAHRDQPTLERSGLNYLGRSIYASFGLEGVDSDLGTSREDILRAFLAWGFDEPQVEIVDTSIADNGSNLITFAAQVTAAVSGTAVLPGSASFPVTGESYRWDFGDGSDIQGPYDSSVVSHKYAVCGTYTVRVEATDSLGNKAISSTTVDTGNLCDAYLIYMPMILK